MPSSMDMSSRSTGGSAAGSLPVANDAGAPEFIFRPALAGTAFAFIFFLAFFGGPLPDSWPATGMRAFFRIFGR